MPVLNKVKDPAVWLAGHQPKQDASGLDLAVQTEQAEQIRKFKLTAWTKHDRITGKWSLEATLFCVMASVESV